MIAKNCKEGKYSDGIINYVFEGRELEHKDKQAHVMAASSDLLLPFSAQDKEGIKELKREFNTRTSDYLKKNPENKNGLIGHQLLSFTPQDEKKLGQEGIKKALEDYLKLAEMEKTQYVAVGHRDTNNYHIHIVYNKVQNNMKKENDHRLNNKTIERGVSLALKNNLTLIDKQGSVALTRGVLDIRIKDQDIKDLRNQNDYLKSARNMHHLTKLMEADKKSPELLQSGKVRIDGKIHSYENLNAVFYLNRTEAKEKAESKQKEHASNGGKSTVNSLKSDGKPVNLSFFTKDLSEEGEKANDKASGKQTKPMNIITIKSEEGKPARRKRRGKQYLLKNKSKLSNDKGLNI